MILIGMIGKIDGKDATLQDNVSYPLGGQTRNTEKYELQSVAVL